MKAQVNLLSARRSKLRGKQSLQNSPRQQDQNRPPQLTPTLQSLSDAIRAIQYQLREMQQPVFFNVYRTWGFQGESSTIPYDLVRLNVGSGMNQATGVFRAPKSGNYLFLFTGYSIHVNTQVNIRKNGGAELLATAFHDQGDDSQGGVLSTQTAVCLREGDTVDAFLVSGEIYDDERGFFTQFTGMLVSHHQPQRNQQNQCQQFG